MLYTSIIHHLLIVCMPLIVADHAAPHSRQRHGSGALQCVVRHGPGEKSARLFDLVAGLFGFASQPEAIADTPRLVVERRAVPLKALNGIIAEDNAIAFVICGLPACSSLPAPRRVVGVCFHAPGFPTVSAQGRLSKKAAGVFPAAR